MFCLPQRGTYCVLQHLLLREMHISQQHALLKFQDETFMDLLGINPLNLGLLCDQHVNHQQVYLCKSVISHPSKPSEKNLYA